MKCVECINEDEISPCEISGAVSIMSDTKNSNEEWPLCLKHEAAVKSDLMSLEDPPNPFWSKGRFTFVPLMEREKA
jgi:hypothetical protein